ncbi:MAG TPA: hypothetical protein VGO06_07560 [Bosea sp. (in: a-proteobacteria)]|jgi:hypothetical protein|uniref:hypothetical protein n=1 Tax=Bosea sp. (in: a-proteobacteria) TaxID=1871050 RepID=UPI002E1467F8|nr:hypothetical protein [Bosea sp. (in: a-proteobacteria)]
MASRRDFAGVASLRAADWLALAAAPTFASMGLLTLVFENDAPTLLCAAMPGAAPMNGMAAMYLLMSVFHLAPWLRLAAGLSSSTSA